MTDSDKPTSHGGVMTDSDKPTSMTDSDKPTSTIEPHQTIPPHAMKRVIIESPYAGDIVCNVDFARRCLRDSLMRGESPLASHLLYTQPRVLDDNDPRQRAHGINAGHAWLPHADYMVVYTDLGITDGMQAGINSAQFNGVDIVFRRLD